MRRFSKTINFHTDFRWISGPFSHRFFINFHDLFGFEFSIDFCINFSWKIASKIRLEIFFFLTKAVSGGQGGGGCRLWLLFGRVLEESDFWWFFDRQKKRPKTQKNRKNVTLGRRGRVDLGSTAGGRKAQFFESWVLFYCIWLVRFRKFVV